MTGADFGQERCVGCGSCNDVCPSARNGGMIPEEAVRSYNEHLAYTDVWKCLQCHRCISACPEDIDVAGIVCAMRNEASSRGDIPERFVRTGQQMKKDLKVFPIIGRMESQRTELGLETVPISADEDAAVRQMLKGPGYDD